MKILYDNYIESATLSATNEDGAYPVENLFDEYLIAPFKSISGASVVTLEFAINKTVSSIALGYHNLTSASYVLQDSGGNPILSGSLETSYDTNMTYFTSTSCRKVEITLASS